MRSAVVAAVVVLLAVSGPILADGPTAGGLRDGRRVVFPDRGLADGIAAAIALLESCHDAGPYQAAEFDKALKGDHVRLSFGRPQTVRILNETLAVSELVFREPTNTGIFWVRAGDAWRRFSKFEPAKTASFAAWLAQATPVP